MQSEYSAQMVQRLKLGLLVALVAAVMLVFLLFFLVGPGTLRIPFLNVQLLPDAEVRQEVSVVAALERPLFWEQRRPVIPPVVEPEPEPEVVIEPLEGVRLLGIMARGDQHVALLEVDGEVQRVGQGADVKQWSVSAIGPQDVQFSSRNKKSLLILKREIHESIKLETKP